MGLSKLIRAGLPVPDGFAIEDAAFRAVVGELDVADEASIGHVASERVSQIFQAELPRLFEEELRRRIETLGPMIAVRSSATIEDREMGSAAGVFSSRRALPRDHAVAAIREVWASALTPLAVAYARRRGGPIAIGVVVQRFVEGERSTIYTRAPGRPADDVALVQRDASLTRHSRAEVPLAVRAEQAIGASATGADVELVGAWLVQARPIVHPPAHPPRHAPPPLVTAALVADGRVWTWDVGHNPDPLSPAQAGLVARVDDAGSVPYSMRVCAGYLYTAPATHRASPAATTLETIERKMAHALGLARREGEDAWAWHDSPAEAPPLAEAIERYVAFAGIYANEMTPLVAASPGRTEAPTSSEPVAVSTQLARLGILSPAWDVAVSTYGERPGVLRAVLGTPGTTARFLGRELRERDDLWFARAQLLVRRAILARADELGIDRDDAFWIPLDELLDGKPLDPDEVRRKASAQRAAAERASRWEMPLVVGGPPPPVGESLRGVGTGPRVVGRVVRFARLGSTVTVGHGDIVVARAVTPALAIQVVGCAALVSETGGLLDHGAALARELGIPCVVGCRDAWSRLVDGMIVIVDGEAGSVDPI